MFKECFLFEMLLVCFTKEVDGDGLNPNAVVAVEAARRSAAVVLNFIGKDILVDLSGNKIRMELL